MSTTRRPAAPVVVIQAGGGELEWATCRVTAVDPRPPRGDAERQRRDGAAATPGPRPPAGARTGVELGGNGPAHRGEQRQGPEEPAAVAAPAAASGAELSAAGAGRRDREKEEAL